MKKIRALFLELPSSSPLPGGVNSLNRSTFSGVEKKERWMQGKKEFGDHGTSVNRVTQRTQRKTAMFLLFMASRQYDTFLHYVLFFQRTHCVGLYQQFQMNQYISQFLEFYKRKEKPLGRDFHHFCNFFNLHQVSLSVYFQIRHTNAT